MLFILFILFNIIFWQIYNESVVTFIHKEKSGY